MYAVVAQLVERVHGKDEVSGSTPDNGSITIIVVYHTINYSHLISSGGDERQLRRMRPTIGRPSYSA